MLTVQGPAERVPRHAEASAVMDPGTVHDIEESGGHHAGVPPPFPDDWSVSGRRSGIQQRTCREA
ncbi:hypothetical protein, partial [Methylobacterium indicum]|uniref:hypothetical protein n=1 Tax=Methylobacterium indicum TaxID=1775910 RepID=UPI001AD94753